MGVFVDGNVVVLPGMEVDSTVANFESNTIDESFLPRTK